MGGIDMEKYTIYCTEEQTKKALELGAPIEISDYEEKEANIFWKLKFLDLQNGLLAEYPTAEQMVGWLEEQGISVKAFCFSWCNENKPTWQVHAYNESTNFWNEITFGHSKSRKEATLTAIDAALDYLRKAMEE